VVLATLLMVGNQSLKTGFANASARKVTAESTAHADRQIAAGKSAMDRIVLQ
jgi:hypothetical protein